MKSILYVGATLMIGASIYGFVDYKQTSKKKEFNNMYTEKKEVVPVISSDEKKAEPVVQMEKTKQAKTKLIKKKVSESDAIVSSKKSIPDDQKLKTPDTDIIGLDEVTIDPITEQKVVEPKKRKKISTKLFSRAPLREDYDDKELPAPSKKKDAKKLEIKEK